MKEKIFKKTGHSVIAGGVLSCFLSGGNVLAHDDREGCCSDYEKPPVAPVAAADEAEPDGMVRSLFGSTINDAQFMKSLGVEVGGWVSFGGTYNTDGPNDRSNAPVSFNDRHLEFQGNQVDFFIERAVNTEGDSWDIGFRADVLFGTDARFTLNDDLDDDLLNDDFSRFYRLSFPQLYAEVYAPVLNGVTAKIGHFYTIIGNEVVTSPDNFFYSHAYTMLYGEPFEHNGVLLSTPITDNVSLMAGGVLGWDNFSRDTDVWNFLGGVSLNSDDGGTALTISAIQGDFGDNGNDGDRWLYSVVLSHDVTDNLHYLIQHDNAREDPRGGPEVEWYGINQYITYDITDQVATGVRFEWFRDDDAARVTDASGSYFAVTAGFNLSPFSWLKVRPEVRYDWFDGDIDVFDGGTEKDQLTVAADMVVVF